MIEVLNGHWCHSDVNIVAALTSPNFVIRGTVIDVDHRLEPLEVEYSYVKMVAPRGGRGRHRKVPGLMVETGRTEGEEGGRIPVVMFALKPHRGRFGLHKYKLKLWHRGALYADTKDYAGKHRRLLDEVKAQLRRKEGELGEELEARRHGASFELHKRSERADEPRRNQKRIVLASD